MKLTAQTREMLAHRRAVRDLKVRGFIQVTENGWPLWELTRGGRWNEKIVETAPSPDGKTVFVRIE